MLERVAKIVLFTWFVLVRLIWSTLNRAVYMEEVEEEAIQLLEAQAMSLLRAQSIEDEATAVHSSDSYDPFMNLASHSAQNHLRGGILSDQDFSGALELHLSHSSANYQSSHFSSRVLSNIMDKSASSTTVSNTTKGPQLVKVQARASVNSSWVTYQTLTFASLVNSTHLRREPRHGKYGGRLDKTPEATKGYFHVKRINDRWTFIDPEGYPFISTGLNSVQPHNGEPFYKVAFAKAFGDTNTWSNQTYHYLFHNIHVNTLGCWSNTTVLGMNGIRAPYCPQWYFMTGYAESRLIKDGVIPVFDPGFERYCDVRAKALVGTAHDPWLLGHFSDNELPLESIDILKRYLNLNATDAGYKAALKWLTERNKTKDSITTQDNADFCAVVIGLYYRIVGTAIKKYDPNHLFLGSRFHGRVLDQNCTFTASGPWLDVISINYYHQWTPGQHQINQWADLGGRPLLASEFYSKGDDSNLTNSGGAGFSVATQRDRGLFYENFALGCLRSHNIVGWHWFKYIDTTVNAGLVNQVFQPWNPLAKSMKSINMRLYSLSDYMPTS